jgi:hypothetical protein
VVSVVPTGVAHPRIIKEITPASPVRELMEMPYCIRPAAESINFARRCPPRAFYSRAAAQHPAKAAPEQLSPEDDDGFVHAF